MPMKPRSEVVEKAVQDLKAEEQRLEKELGALTDREKALAAELKRVRGAIQALIGKEEPGSGEAKETMTPSLVKDVVLQALKRGMLPLPRLKEEVLKAAKTKGLSGTGIHQVLRRVLQDKQFQETDQGYTLRSLEA